MEPVSEEEEKGKVSWGRDMAGLECLLKARGQYFQKELSTLNVST